MLTYTFSQREKLMLAFLTILLLGVLWYKFVFEGVNNQLESLDSQIATAQDTLIVDSYKINTMRQMQEALEGYQSEGATMKVMPNFDNIGPLTAELNGTLSAATTYKLEFDKKSSDDKSEEEANAASADTMQRGVKLEFDCDSYATARSILSALVGGKFPCTIDSLSIIDNSVRNGTRLATNTGSAFSVTAHLTFYEKFTSEQIAANRAAAAAAAAEAQGAA